MNKIYKNKDEDILRLKYFIGNLYFKLDDYNEALSLYRSKAIITYKRGLTDTLISPYNTPILATLKANMNIQYVTGVYAVLAYLTSYLCKPEHSLGELMKKAVKLCRRRSADRSRKKKMERGPSGCCRSRWRSSTTSRTAQRWWASALAAASLTHSQ